MDNQFSLILRCIKLLAIANACWILSSLIPEDILDFWDFNSELISIINWLVSFTAFILMILVAVVASSNSGCSQNEVNPENSVTDYSAPMEGIAISCLISIATVITLAVRNDDFLLSVAIWFLYIVFAGLSINTHSATRIRKVVLYSLYPSVTLLVGSMSFLAFVYILDTTVALSGNIGSLSQDGSFTKLLLAYLLMSLLSVPSISFACLARTRLIELYGKSKSITVAELKQLQKKINIIGAIIVFILGAILATEVNVNG